MDVTILEKALITNVTMKNHALKIKDSLKTCRETSHGYLKYHLCC